MKTIKVFFASSEELENDRDAFGNFVRRLNSTYNKRGIHIELFEWEDYDAAYNSMRKQDEYNNQVKESDIFLAVFHRLAGKFTIEEFDIACEECRKKNTPKIFVYCKDLKEGEEESSELSRFKQRLCDEMGHYWKRYASKDALQLHFVMQLQLMETSDQSSLKVENGIVLLADMPIAKMDRLQFAAGNEAYQKMSSELADLPAKIDKARQRLEKFPDDDDLQDDLQQKLNRYNSLKEEFAKLQESLFETARRIASMQLERCSNMLRRAIDAFESGDVGRANILLDELSIEAEQHMAQLDQQRALVHQDIEAFQLQTKTIMADTNIPIDERVERIIAIYNKSEDWAEKSALDREKYATLLFDYANFLCDYAKYHEALELYSKSLKIREELFGPEHPEVATIHDNIGVIYQFQDNYTEALRYHLSSLKIREKVRGIKHPDTATSYDSIGCLHYLKGYYTKALECFLKSLKIREEVLGTEHSDTATSYNNIGNVYSHQGDYNNALEYLLNAQKIFEAVFGIEHPETAISLNNIGVVYNRLGNHPKALEYSLKALEIQEKMLGIEHPMTATSYISIGLVYYDQGDYPKALEYHLKALKIREDVLGTEHSDTAVSYNNVGGVYNRLGDYPKALEYRYKALAVFEKVLGPEHPNTAAGYNNIGVVYDKQGNYDKAMEYYLKAIKIREAVLGPEHPATIKTREHIEDIRNKCK